MVKDLQAISEALVAFGQAHPTWVIYDPATESLIEVHSGRALKLPLDEISGVVEQRNALSGAPFLLVELKDGRQLALADAGIAFRPVAPPVPLAPLMQPIVCMRDFEAQRALVEAALRDSGARPGRETLGAAATCLGILEGARRVGLDISREQRALEALLGELERRK